MKSIWEELLKPTLIAMTFGLISLGSIYVIARVIISLKGGSGFW
jgi:hypothetical protein